jgi:hypothetical protein
MLGKCSTTELHPQPLFSRFLTKKRKGREYRAASGRKRERERRKEKKRREEKRIVKGMGKQKGR